MSCRLLVAPALKSWKPCSVPTGTCTTHVALTTVSGKALARPTAKNKKQTLRLDVPSGTWFTVDGSQGDCRAHLDDKDWAATHTKRTQRTASKITGPRYFKQSQLGNADSAEIGHD